LELNEVTISAFVRTCGLEQGDVVGSSEHGKESSGSITCREFFGYLRSYYILNKAPAPWNQSVTLEIRRKATHHRANISSFPTEIHNLSNRRFSSILIALCSFPPLLLHYFQAWYSHAPREGMTSLECVMHSSDRGEISQKLERRILRTDFDQTVFVCDIQRTVHHGIFL